MTTTFEPGAGRPVIEVVQDCLLATVGRMTADGRARQVGLSERPAACLREAFAAIPGCLTLTAAPKDGPAAP